MNNEIKLKVICFEKNIVIYKTEARLHYFIFINSTKLAKSKN